VKTTIITNRSTCGSSSRSIRSATRLPTESSVFDNFARHQGKRISLYLGSLSLGEFHRCSCSEQYICDRCNSLFGFLTPEFSATTPDSVIVPSNGQISHHVEQILCLFQSFSWLFYEWCTIRTPNHPSVHNDLAECTSCILQFRSILPARCRDKLGCEQLGYRQAHYSRWPDWWHHRSRVSRPSMGTCSKEGGGWMYRPMVRMTPPSNVSQPRMGGR
jgi:hypothetical protein